MGCRCRVCDLMAHARFKPLLLSARAKDPTTEPAVDLATGLEAPVSQLTETSFKVKEAAARAIAENRMAGQHWQHGRIQRTKPSACCQSRLGAHLKQRTTWRFDPDHGSRETFALLLLVLKRTALGLQVRAVSQNRAMDEVQNDPRVIEVYLGE